MTGKPETDNLMRLLAKFDNAYIKIRAVLQEKEIYGTPSDQDICDLLFKAASDASVIFIAAGDASKEWGSPSEKCFVEGTADENEA